MTVVGLCFGGGQLGLGIAGSVTGLLALWLLPWIERRIRREHRARLSVELSPEGPEQTNLRRRLEEAGLSIIGTRAAIHTDSERREYLFELRQLRKFAHTEPPAVFGELAQVPGVIKLVWDALR